MDYSGWSGSAPIWVQPTGNGNITQGTGNDPATIDTQLEDLRSQINSTYQQSFNGARYVQWQIQQLQASVLHTQNSISTAQPQEAQAQFNALFQYNIDQNRINVETQRRLAALEIQRPSAGNYYLDNNDPVVRRSSINSLQATVDTLETYVKGVQFHIKELQDQADNLQAVLTEHQSTLEEQKAMFARAEVEDATGKVVYPDPETAIQPLRQQNSPLIPTGKPTMTELQLPTFTFPPVGGYRVTRGDLTTAGTFRGYPYKLPGATTQPTFQGSFEMATTFDAADFHTTPTQNRCMELIQTPSRSKLNAIESAVGMTPTTSNEPAQFPKQTLSALFPMLFYRIETWCKEWTTVLMSALATKDTQSAILLTAAEQVCGKPWGVREFIESPSRFFLIAAIISRIVVREVLDTNIIRQLQTDLALKYNQMSLDNWNYWHNNAMDFAGRGKNCSELAVLAANVINGPGFWAWEETQVDRVTRLIFDKVANLISPARHANALYTLRPIVDNAFRLKIRMMKEVHEYHFLFHSPAERFDVPTMIVRDDPDQPYTADTTPLNYWVRICMAPTIKEKTFGEIMTTETIHKGHVLLALKKPRKHAGALVAVPAIKPAAEK